MNVRHTPQLPNVQRSAPPLATVRSPLRAGESRVGKSAVPASLERDISVVLRGLACIARGHILQPFSDRQDPGTGIATETNSRIRLHQTAIYCPLQAHLTIVYEPVSGLESS